MTPEIWDGLIKLAALIGLGIPLFGLIRALVRLVRQAIGFCERVELKIDKLTQANVDLCGSIAAFAERIESR